MAPVLKTNIEEVLLEKIQANLPQPRKDLTLDKGEEKQKITQDEDSFEEDADEEDKEKRLRKSLEEDGLGSAITVVKRQDGTYQIINGHRRYKCAKSLGWKTIRCEIHQPFSDEGDMEKLRLNIQTNLRQWKPLERAAELQRIREKKKFKTNRELAEYLHYPESLLSNSFALHKRSGEYQKLMDKYKLTPAYQSEFIKLEPKIRPIKEFTIPDIVENIFSRVKYEVIKSAKDFRKLSSIFLRAHTNEGEIYAYLKDNDMRVDDLYENTKRSGYLRDVEKIRDLTIGKIDQNMQFTIQEKDMLRELFEIIKNNFDFS